MKRLMFVAMVVILTATACTVQANDGVKIEDLGDEVRVSLTADVYNSFPGPNVYRYTQAEREFIASVPVADGLRLAVDQMLRGGLVHVPECGVYTAGDSVRYWSMYQGWTAPKRVPISFTLPKAMFQAERVVEKIIERVEEQCPEIVQPAAPTVNNNITVEIVQPECTSWAPEPEPQVQTRLVFVHPVGNFYQGVDHGVAPTVVIETRGQQQGVFPYVAGAVGAHLGRSRTTWNIQGGSATATGGQGGAGGDAWAGAYAEGGEGGNAWQSQGQTQGQQQENVVDNDISQGVVVDIDNQNNSSNVNSNAQAQD